jgi:hypothetical protein
MTKQLVFIICLISIKGFSFPKDSLKPKIGILPSAFYTPETRLAFGGLIYSHFKTKLKDTIIKKSNTQSYFSYSINKQFFFANDYQIWLKKNYVYLTGTIEYSRFPSFFYGIGNNTKESDKMMVYFDVFKTQTKSLIKISNKFYGGILFHYQKVVDQTSDFMPDNLCAEMYGNMGFQTKGIGSIIMLDNRNNPLNPSKGYYIEASYTDYKNVFNNKNMFTNLTVDLRRYHTFLHKLIWNGNLYMAFNKGDVPHLLLAEIGGPRFLRGYYRGRFRDNNVIIAQQEFRMPIYKVLGLAVFGGIGEVASTINQFKKNQIHYSYGAGLRIKINKKENSNIRIDYGITKDSQGLYVVFAEAF